MESKRIIIKNNFKQRKNKIKQNKSKFNKNKSHQINNKIKFPKKFHHNL